MSRLPGRQRSVLVVGDGLTAAATAGFLDQAGLDPVVAPPPSRQRPTGVTVLWRPGLVLLERIGLRRPVERVGQPLTCRHCLTTDRSWTAEAAAATDQSALVAVDRRRLASLLDSYVLSTVRVTDRAVTAVDPTTSGVRSTFAGGVTECFDAVVTASRALVSDREPTAAGVGWWRFEWPDGVADPPAPAELWNDRRAALFMPTSDGVDVRLVSTAATDAGSVLSPVDLGRQFGELFAQQPAPFAALDDRQLQYRQLRGASPTTLSDRRLVPVGAASRGVVPGDCLEATRGIEDAWIVADTLAYGPDEVESALDDADRRRRQRAREYVAAVEATFESNRHSTASGHPTNSGHPADRSPWLRRLLARRRLAFSHLIDGRIPRVAESIPQRL